MIKEIGGCLLRIQEMSGSLSPQEQKLAQYIVDHPNKVVNMAIGELAAACDVSVSTVVRLSKSLHFTGFKDLCRNLCCDLSLGENRDFSDVHSGDNLDTVMRNVCLCNIRAIEDTMSVLSVDALSKAVELLSNATRIDFYGIGSSGMVAKDASLKFTRINKTIVTHTDPHSQMLSAFTLKPTDVAVLISYSGETADMLSIAREIRKQGCPIITVTQYKKNTLASLGSVALYCVSKETMRRIGAMSSRIVQHTILDILYTAVCSHNYEEVKPYLERSQEAADLTR